MFSTNPSKDPDHSPQTSIPAMEALQRKGIRIPAIVYAAVCVADHFKARVTIHPGAVGGASTRIEVQGAEYDPLGMCLRTAGFEAPEEDDGAYIWWDPDALN